MATNMSLPVMDFDIIYLGNSRNIYVLFYILFFFFHLLIFPFQCTDIIASDIDIEQKRVKNKHQTMT